MDVFLTLLAAYLIGSISFGYMAAKLLKGIDIRKHGSGNTGTTNIQRTIGTLPAIIVLILDILKGLAAIYLARAVHGEGIYTMLAGVAVIAGHNWPVFLGFKGGRGIATSIGVLLGLAPVIILIATGIGLIIIAITRYVSLGSIIGSVSIPILMVVFDMETSYIVFGIVLAAFAVFRHRQNIQRLLSGTENKLGKKVELPNEKVE